MIDPFIAGSALTAGAGLIGGITGSKSSARSAAKAQEAQIQWEMYRAQNAHQWEVADLKKAGLNPILAVGGSGAVTGGISAPVPDTSGYTAAGQAVGQGLASALDAKRLENETDKNTAEITTLLKDALLKDKQAHLVDQQAISELAKRGQIKADTAHKLALASYTSSQKAGQDIQNQIANRTINTQIAKTQLELDILKKQRKILIKEGRYKEAQTLQEEENAKHAALNYWLGAAGKTTSALMGLGVTAATAGKAAPLFQTTNKIGFTH